MAESEQSELELPNPNIKMDDASEVSGTPSIYEKLEKVPLVEQSNASDGEKRDEGEVPPGFKGFMEPKKADGGTDVCSIDDSIKVACETEEESSETESEDDSSSSYDSSSESSKGGVKDDVEDIEEGEIKDLDQEEVAICSDEDTEELIAGPSKSKHADEVFPPVPKIQVFLEPRHRTLLMGVISSILGTRVIVEGSEKHNPLNEGSILWITETRSQLGLVDEIFGPVKTPYYVVRYNSETELPVGINVGTSVSIVPEFADHILNYKDLYQKGYDAPHEIDGEASDELEFSDDEKEAEYKRSIRQSKRAVDRGSQRPITDKRTTFRRPSNDRSHGNTKTSHDKIRTSFNGAPGRKFMQPSVYCVPPNISASPQAPPSADVLGNPPMSKLANSASSSLGFPSQQQQLANSASSSLGFPSQQQQLQLPQQQHQHQQQPQPPQPPQQQKQQQQQQPQPPQQQQQLQQQQQQQIGIQGQSWINPQVQQQQQQQQIGIQGQSWINPQVLQQPLQQIDIQGQSWINPQQPQQIDIQGQRWINPQQQQQQQQQIGIQGQSWIHPQVQQQIGIQGQSWNNPQVQQQIGIQGQSWINPQVQQHQNLGFYSFPNANPSQMQFIPNLGSPGNVPWLHRPPNFLVGPTSLGPMVQSSISQAPFGSSNVNEQGNWGPCNAQTSIQSSPVILQGGMGPSMQSNPYNGPTNPVGQMRPPSTWQPSFGYGNVHEQGTPGSRNVQTVVQASPAIVQGGLGPPLQLNPSIGPNNSFGQMGQPSIGQPSFGYSNLHGRRV